MTLQHVTIGGKAGKAAFFDATLRMVPASEAVVSKVVFEDGTRAFYVVNDAQARAAVYDPNQPRDDQGRWTFVGGVPIEVTTTSQTELVAAADDAVHKVTSGQEARPLTLKFKTEQAARIAHTRTIQKMVRWGKPKQLTDLPDGSIVAVVQQPSTGDLGLVHFVGREMTVLTGPVDETNRIALHLFEQPLGEQQTALLKDYMDRHVVRMFHGTTSEALDAIRKGGLKPAAQAGADAVAGNNMLGTRPASVFMATDVGMAQSFAEMAQTVHGGRAVVLQIEIPEDERKNIKPDELMNAPVLAVRYEHTIPASWIRRVGHEVQTQGGRHVKWADFETKPRGAAARSRGPMTVYAVMLVDDPSEPRTAAEFDESKHPRDDKGQFTEVGITSARPEGDPGHTSNKVVFERMRKLEGNLKLLKRVENVRVQPGVGAWQGGSEPTWVVSYKGNGEALKLLAQTAKEYNQDAVLVVKGGSGEGGTSVADEFEFDRAVGSKARDAVHAVLAAEGLGGWTWFKRGGKTVLRAIAVPQWGGDPAAHREASRRISESLSKVGFTHRLLEKPVAVTVLERDKGDYDRLAS